MVPERYIRHSIRNGELLLHYLTEADHPWLRSLLDEYERFVGRPRRELDERMASPLPHPEARCKVPLAAHVLDRSFRTRRDTAVPPKEAREAVFGEAARQHDAPEAVIQRVATRLGVGSDDLEESLFGDLPGERKILPPEHPVGPSELALQANLAQVQAILHRSSTVEIEVHGNARAVVRHAKLRGLICTVAPRREKSEAVLELSGPYSLFKRTLLYGRALAELVPILAWCSRFCLRSQCEVRERSLRFVLRSGDPIFPSREPRRYDSRLEERFARDFTKHAPLFDLIREPEAIEASGTLVFPDFAVYRRSEPARRWLIEIIGFWTPEYLATKLERLRASQVKNLILCIDEDRNCSDQDLPPGTPIVRFRRRIDPKTVLEAIGP